MFEVTNICMDNKQEFYKQLNKHLMALVSEETDWLSSIANASALLFQFMPDINWAGFYLLKSDELILGPFQGNPACVRIALGKGVCGTAASRREILIVEDVNLFPGHIACDATSKSEIVLPIVYRNKLYGVLDIDSPITARFDSNDANGLVDFVNTLNKYIEWPEQFY